MTSAKPKAAADLQGLEYDWLASDGDGFVGLFSTAGAGYAPVTFLLDTDAHDAAIDAILALPASTTAKFAPAVGPGLVNTWKLVAERGLYAFDCDPNGGPYRLVAAPSHPVHKSALPAEAASVVERLVLRVRFVAQTTITPDVLREEEL